MPHRDPSGKPRGYFAIGVYQPKFEDNIGQLWRHAWLYDAAWIFTIGHRYRRQPTDTVKATRQLPLFNYPGLDWLTTPQPYECELVCVELTDDAVPLPVFVHPERAIYLLGAEDHGLPPQVTQGRRVVSIPTPMPQSMNVATAGTLVMHDRYVKQLQRTAQLTGLAPWPRHTVVDHVGTDADRARQARVVASLHAAADRLGDGGPTLS